MEEILDPNGEGRVLFEQQEDKLLRVTFLGRIPLELVLSASDRIIAKQAANPCHVLYDVGQSVPDFSPVALLDEVRRVGKVQRGRVRFAYLAPTHMFTRQFMLIEAAAFNAGIPVKFFSDDAEARAWLLQG